MLENAIQLRISRYARMFDDWAGNVTLTMRYVGGWKFNNLITNKVKIIYILEFTQSTAHIETR